MSAREAGAPLSTRLPAPTRMRIIGDTRYPLSTVITVSGLPEWITPDLLLPYLDEAYDSGFEGLAAYQLELSPADSTFANEGRGKRVILGFDSASAARSACSFWNKKYFCVDERRSCSTQAHWHGEFVCRLACQALFTDQIGIPVICYFPLSHPASQPRARTNQPSSFSFEPSRDHISISDARGSAPRGWMDVRIAARFGSPSISRRGRCDLRSSPSCRFESCSPFIVATHLQAKAFQIVHYVARGQEAGCVDLELRRNDGLARLNATTVICGPKDAPRNGRLSRHTGRW